MQHLFRAPWFRYAALFALVLSFQFARSMNRASDPDEFQFVAPPALLTEFHKLPYVDYPYFHMPNLIFVQAGLTCWTSYKLLVARTFACLCGTCTIALLFAAGWKILSGVMPRTRWILCGGLTLIFATCRLFTYTSGNAWNHDSAVLCMLATFLMFARGMRQASVRWIIAAAFFAGFATGIRLSFALCVIPLAVWVMIGRTSLSNKQRCMTIAGAIIAATIANLPSICLASLAPNRFVFGNIGYSNLSTAYYRSMPDAHAITFIGKIGSSLSKFITDPCNLFILVAFCIALASFFFTQPKPVGGSNATLRSELRLLIGLLISLWIGAMGPTPMMQQYNYALVPFMVLVIFYSIALVQVDEKLLKKITRVVALATIVLGGTGILRWYWSVIYLPVPSHWQPLMEHEDAAWIRRLTRPAARILTIESAIPLEAGLEIYPEYTTGRFVLLVEKFETPGLRQQHGLVGPAELNAMLIDRPPDAVFTRNDLRVDKPFIDYAKSNRFVAHDAPDGYSTLWVRPGLGPRHE